MDLLPIAAGRHIVLAALDDSEKCQPLDLIQERLSVDGKDALVLLKKFLPATGLEGAPKFRQRSEGRGIVSFRVSAELILYFFTDGPQVILCAGADVQGQGREIGLQTARTTQREYFKARSRRALVFLPLTPEQPLGKYDVN